VPEALDAKWRKKLAASGFEDIELPNGQLKAEQPGGRLLSMELARDRPRRMVSWEHEHLQAAVWRYRFRPARLRRAAQALADGKGMRAAARAAHVSLTVVVQLRRDILAWRDQGAAEDADSLTPWGSPSQRRRRERRDARIRQALADKRPLRDIARDVRCSLSTVVRLKKATNGNA
jgi:transposase-like protein